MNEITARPDPGHYMIDPDRSTIAFGGRHLFGLLPVRGTFSIRSGTVDVTEPLADSRIRVEMDTASFRTGGEQRDRSVRSARFLDAGRHPVMSFVSERVAPDSIAGTLTVGEVAWPVGLAIERAAVRPGTFTARATTRIDRTEFGVTAAPGLAGRHLDVTLEVTCVRI
jgi:polyisoprenoid-binding protein YceI